MPRLLLLIAVLFPCAAIASTTLGDFAQRDKSPKVRLSPAGDYLGFTFPVGEDSGLVVIRLSDRKVMSKVSVGGHREVADFWWAGPERLVLTVAQQFGPSAKSYGTGEMLGINADGSDRQELHGYLTLPKNHKPEQLPLVVNPHGGPFGVADQWHWDQEAQLLASRGYAVLQVNFRGSPGYGKAFSAAGRKSWDSVIINDISDGAHWAVASGYADPKRLCIYGASYGGYAALMSIGIEPDLYRCAIGYAGVYDLPLLRSDSDITDSVQGRNYFSDWIGNDEKRLEQASPTQYVERFKAAILLVHGTDDERAPYSQFEAMTAALNAVKYPYEKFTRLHEGHGFYLEKNREEFFKLLLAFLDRNIGPQNAVPKPVRD